MSGAVLCAGRVYGDLVFSGVPRLPALGTEVFADALSLHAGGGAYITAAWLAALGRPAELCAMLPREPFAGLVRAEAMANGVGLAASRVATEGDPQLTVAHVAGGDRAFTTRRSGAALPPAHLDALAMPGLRHLHVSELSTLLEYPTLVAAARAAGLSVSLDCGWDDAMFTREDLATAFAGIDVFLPNEAEAEALGESALNAFALPLIVIKRGARGASARTPDGACHRPARELEAIDTTGAGDAFDAGFLHAWLGGHPLETSLALGNACGALAVTRRGGAGLLPALDELVGGSSDGALSGVPSAVPLGAIGP